MILIKLSVSRAPVRGFRRASLITCVRGPCVCGSCVRVRVPSVRGAVFLCARSECARAVPCVLCRSPCVRVLQSRCVCPQWWLVFAVACLVVAVCPAVSEP